MNETKTTRTLYNCEECEYKTDRIQNWRSHLCSVAHRERKSLPVIHTCRDCSKEFRDTENYVSHRLFGLCEHPKCDYCGKFYNTKQNLKTHLRTSKKCCLGTDKLHFINCKYEILRKKALRSMESDNCPESKYLCRDWYVSNIKNASSNEN